jgi:uncharacterized protein (UPF0261 family)
MSLYKIYAAFGPVPTADRLNFPPGADFHTKWPRCLSPQGNFGSGTGTFFMNSPRAIAVTVSDATQTGATAAAEFLEQAGWKAQLFRVEDGGGAAFEAFLSKGQAAGALDYTLGDLAEMRLRGTNLTKDRLTTAAMKGLPQVIVPGGIDCVAFRSRPPSGFDDRIRHSVNAFLTLIRTNREDNDAFGKELAFKASASKGPVVIAVPRGGLSVWDGLKRPLDLPLANQAFLESLYQWKSPRVEVVESDRHVNDYFFAQIAAERLLKMLVGRTPGRRK